MKILMTMLLFVSLISVGETAEVQNKDKPSYRDWEKISTAYKTKPKRFGGNLRQENINDIEVREIVRVTNSVLPGVIVSIDGVRAVCPCGDGPDCTAQVWVVDYTSEQSKGLMLSKIDGKWKIGPVQSWWHLFESVQNEIRVARSSLEDSTDKIAALHIKLTEMWEYYPKCAD